MNLLIHYFVHINLLGKLKRNNTNILIFKHKYGFIKKIINNVRNTRC